jgi:Carboxypeptidase regulatory-like domain
VSRRGLILLPFATTWLICLPTTVIAQSAIAGAVKDSSGAVLPGVNVEATSQVLIEKSKTATTNEAGEYRLIDLRPGTYTVTFTLAGFQTVVRNDIILESSFIATVNAEMAVNFHNETITVSGAPVVDVRSAQRREVVTEQMMDALPTGRNYQLMSATVPAVTTGVFDVGGSTTMWTGGSLQAHGSLASDSRTSIDGMVADCLIGAGQSACQYDNEAQTQEIAVQVTGGAAEYQLSGVLVNRIPRIGGNEFHGQGLVLFSNTALQDTNLDDDLRARGLATPSELYRSYDINYSVGGPIVEDRVWFFVSGRHNAYEPYVAGAFNPDGTRAIDDSQVKSFPARLTARLTPKDRLTVFFDWANKVRGHRRLSANVTPAASLRQSQPAEHIAQVKWTSTLAPRLLLETGYTQQFNGDRFAYEPEVVPATCHVAYLLCPPGTGYGSISHHDTVLMTESVAARPQPAGGQSPGGSPALSHYWMASASYVSRAHNLKVGVQHRWGYSKDIRPAINGDIVQQYQSGVPSTVLVLNTPISNQVDVNADLGVYIQDTWTRRRLTLSPGLRWDHFNSSLPAQTLAAGRFVPARHFDAIKNLPDWNNVSPRIGLAYDLTARGKTVAKGNFGLYVESGGPGYARTYSPAVFATDQRTWDDRNKDDVAQEDEIGPPRDIAFGVQRNLNVDPGIKRPYQQVWDVGIQHELLPGLAVSVSYNERRFYRMIWRRNVAIPFSEYTRLTIEDPRNNGQTLPLYNVNRSVFGQVDQLDANSRRNTRIYRGIDATFSWRLPNGGALSGGTSTGRTLTRTCDVEDPNSLRFCDYNQYEIPFQTLSKLSGTYPLRYGIRVSGTFQHTPGAERVIVYQVTRRQVPSLVAASVSIRLNEPGTLFNDTVNQLDVALSKSFRRGPWEIRPEISLFNAFNANPVLTQTNSFGSALGNAVTILPPRAARVGLRIDF